MYPYLRTLSALWQACAAGPAGLFDSDEITLRVWPNDLDMFLELNNGRTLTLYDLGRFSIALRVGLIGALRRNGWGLAVAGVSVRFRRRVTLFQRLRIRTALVGWDDRFIYLQQALWRGDTCCSHLLIRTAVTGKDGVVPPNQVLAAIGQGDATAPDLPDWATVWITSDNARPWPPDF